MAWTTPHRAYAVETYIKTGESVISTQRAFRRHFMIRRNNGVPDRKSILLWVQNFRTVGTLVRSPGRPRKDQTPEKGKSVRRCLMLSPPRSARKLPSPRTKKVGQVLKDRKKRGQIEYLIRWKNFGAEEDSWEPESNLKNAGSILQDYIKNKATRKSRRSSSRSRSRSRSRTRLTRKKTDKEVASRESTPLKKSSRESTPVKKREPTPIKSLELETPIEEDLEKAPPPAKEATPPPSPPSPPTEDPVPPEPEEVTPEPPLKVVMELTNDGVEETPLTTFTSQITTETTEIFTPVSESVSTVLTRRMEMRAAAKATELEEEQKLLEEEIKEPEVIELAKEVEEAKMEEEVEAEEEIKEPEVVDDDLDAPAPVPAAEDDASSRKRLINISGRKWPMILFILCLLVVGISIWVEKYFN